MLVCPSLIAAKIYGDEEPTRLSNKLQCNYACSAVMAQQFWLAGMQKSIYEKDN